MIKDFVATHAADLRMRKIIIDGVIANEIDYQTVKKDGKEPTFDLTTVEGWKKQNEFMIEQALNKRLGPVEKTLSDVQTKEQMKVFNSRME